jgi:hypothetical protein
VRKKIGQCLIYGGQITGDELHAALAEHVRTGERVGAVLIRLNFATESQVTKALAYQLGFPYVSLAEDPPDPWAIVLIPKPVARRHVCVAVKLERQLLTVATSDPLLFGLVQDLEMQTGFRIRQVVAPRSDILQAIEDAYPDKALVKYEGGGALVRCADRADAAQQRLDGPVCPRCGARLEPGQLRGGRRREIAGHSETRRLIRSYTL